MLFTKYNEDKVNKTIDRLKIKEQKDDCLNLDNYVINGIDYNIDRTCFYSNGNVRSKGLIITEFDVKSGEWLYYDADGLLNKKEVYQKLFQSPITTHYNSDGTIKKE